MASSDPNILITGAAGQLGVELTSTLRAKYGADRVLATDIREPNAHDNGATAQKGSSAQNNEKHDDGPFERLDVLDRKALTDIIRRYRIDTVYHLAAILSAKGEQNPETTWRLNIDGLLNVLEIARTGSVNRIFWPSSIAVYGPDAPSDQTPQYAPLNPVTVYGISKVAGEHWCSYYHRRFGVDVRSLRYPGLIGWKSNPGGGTTDYAVDMLHAAVNGDHFSCPVDRNTRLPMMYMDDAVKAAVNIMSAKPDAISIRTSYNITAMSFTPDELAKMVREHRDQFEIRYAPDERDVIAQSWPNSIDDHPAKADWGWEPEFDLRALVDTFMRHQT